MRRIWRSTRDLLRFDRFTNMASSLPWRAASLAAMRSSSPRICLDGARHVTYLVGGVHIDGFPVGRRVLAIVLADAAAASGSRMPAASSALARSRYSGRSTDLAVTIVNHAASTKTTIITTPIASADRMAPSRAEPLGEWIRVPCRMSVRPITQNAMTATATAGMVTSSSRRERTCRFFSSRRAPLGAADAWVRECWWPPAGGLMLSGRRAGSASCTAGIRSRRVPGGTLPVRPPRVSPMIRRPGVMRPTHRRDPCGLSLFVLDKSLPQGGRP